MTIYKYDKHPNFEACNKNINENNNKNNNYYYYDNDGDNNNNIGNTYISQHHKNPRGHDVFS